MRLLRRFVAPWLVALSVSSICSAATPQPEDFAYAMPLQLQGDAAIYTLPVPKDVYQYALRTDLGDMRIFNSDDEWVTYSVSTPLTKSSREPLVNVPSFPLYGDPARALDRFKITIDSEQGAVNLQSADANATKQVESYVIDVRNLTQPITALELHWPDDATEFSGHVSIESSDDLSSWSVVASNLPVVNLKFGDQQLLQNRLDFTATNAKYLRLRWTEQAAPFVINEVLAEVAPTQTEAVREQALAVGRTIPGQPDMYDFTLDLHAPVDRINLQLAQPNTIANVTLSSRAQPTLPWRDVATLRVYDLQNNGTTLRNTPIMITPNSDRYWRMQTNTAGSLGKGVPTLQVGWLPQEITFVARGHAPFQLTFGSATIAAATSPLQNLLADPRTPISVATASVGNMHELGGTTRLVVKQEVPWKTWALWGVLIAAVGVLGTIAYRLSREMSN